MRTLASTFSTWNEAEMASRRLEAIGIGRERIVIKDVAPAAGVTPEPGAGGGVFLSVKVTTEQVQPVSEILKGRWTGDDPVVPGFRSLGEDVLPEPATELPPRPLLFPAAERETVPPPDPAQPQAAAARPARGERERLGRQLVLFGLALVAAFILGAWLGLLS